MIALFAKKLPLTMSKSMAQEWIDNPSHFESTIAKTLMPAIEPEVVVGSIDEHLSPWIEFYKKYFGIVVDLPGLRSLQIPAKVAGFDRLIIVVQGIGLNEVWKICVKRFKCYKYTDSDLESLVTENDRDPANGSYAVWVRDVVEADGDMKNLSAKDLAEKSIKGVTLLERLIHELKYFSETGKHLDIDNVTLCSGSRYSDGDVPDAGWFGDELGVGWADPASRGSRLRSRVAVG